MNKFFIEKVLVFSLVFLVCKIGFSQDRQFGFDEPFKLFERDKTVKFEQPPQAFKFIDYTGEGSVNKTNGKFELSIPFYTYKDDFIELPIGVNYSTSGVKMSEDLSTVGINWDLVAGGQITRHVKGMPDDLTSSTSGTSSNRKHHNAFTGRFYGFFGSRKMMSANFGTGGITYFDQVKYDNESFLSTAISHPPYFGSIRGKRPAFYMYHFPKRYNHEPTTGYQGGYLPSLAESKKWTIHEFKYLSGRSTNDFQRDIFKVSFGNLDFSFILQEEILPDTSSSNYQYGDSGWETYYKAIPLNDKGYKIAFIKGDIPLYHKWIKTSGGSNRKYTNSDGIQMYDDTPGNNWERTRSTSNNGIALYDGYNSNTVEGIIGFIITDKKGIEYHFNELEIQDQEFLSSHVDNNFVTDSGGTWHLQPSTPGTKAIQWGMDSSLTTAWKISKIILTNGEEINFNYNDVVYNHENEVKRSHTGEYNNYRYNLSPMWHPTTSDYYVNKRVTTHELNSISTPNSIIEFKYKENGLGSRQDINSSFNTNLEKVLIKYSVTGDIIREFTLNKTIYEAPGNSSGSINKRMFLESITDSRVERSYSFIYDNPELLKKKNTAQFQDIWGYPIENTGGIHPSFPKFYVSPSNPNGHKIMYTQPKNPDYFEFAGSNRAVNENYNKTGTLKTIQFPTRGFLNIEYESNSYYDAYAQGDNVKGPGLRVSKLIYKDYDNQSKLIKKYDYNLISNPSFSSGQIMYRPSFAYIGNDGYDNQVDMSHIENHNYSKYNTNFYVSYNEDKNTLKKGVQADDTNYDAQFLTTSDKELLLKKLIKVSNYPLGKIYDMSGNEIIYTEINESIQNESGTRNIGSTRYYNHYDDNRTLVQMSGGNSTEFQYVEPDIVLGGVSEVTPTITWDDWFVSYGLMEIQGKDIYPFPERDYFANTGRLNGQRKKVEYRNENGSLLKKEDFEYELSQNVNRSIISITNKFDPTYTYYNPSNQNPNQTYQIYTGPWYTDSCFGNCSWRTNGDYINYTSPLQSQILVGVNFFSVNTLEPEMKTQLKKRIVTQDNLTQEYEYEYENEYLLLAKDKSQNSKFETVEREFTYPFQVPTENDNSELLLRDIVKNPVKLIIKNNGEVLSKSETIYKLFSIPSAFGTKVLPQKQTSQKLNGEVVEKIIYDKYDEHDNLLQYHTPEGTYSSVIWGYNNNFPVLKIEGATYDQITASLNNANMNAIENGSEDGISGVSEILRQNFPQANITTYTYEPLIGLKSMTDAKGYTTYYEYDSFDRLKYIRDENQDIIEYFDYKYKDQE